MSTLESSFSHSLEFAAVLFLMSSICDFSKLSLQIRVSHFVRSVKFLFCYICGQPVTWKDFLKCLAPKRGKHALREIGGGGHHFLRFPNRCSQGKLLPPRGPAPRQASVSAPQVLLDQLECSTPNFWRTESHCPLWYQPATSGTWAAAPELRWGWGMRPGGSFTQEAHLGKTSSLCLHRHTPDSKCLVRSEFLNGSFQILLKAQWLL